MEAAQRETMYFIGVTTGKSAIMQVFPRWMEALGEDLRIQGIDLPVRAEPSSYRETVAFIKADPLSKGALVTTHKIDLYQAAKDYFDILGPDARRFSELSSISKSRDGKLLIGHAKDPQTCGMAMEEFIPKNYWKEHPNAEVMIMGAGGSAISMCAYFLRKDFIGNQPKRIIVTNRSPKRLEALRKICGELNPGTVQTAFYLTPDPGQNDSVLSGISPGSLVVNATGLGKDRPGSPLLDTSRFPKNAMVWEINYRGDLRFLHQARSQAAESSLSIHDGWMYFVYGWTQVIAEVIHRPIAGELLYKLSDIARKAQEEAS